MLSVLYWVCYAVVFGTATCFAAYKTAVVQRTLAVALRRGLRGMMHDIASQSEECTITHTNTGEGSFSCCPTAEKLAKHCCLLDVNAHTSWT